MMTRKDFRAIAEAVREIKDEDDRRRVAALLANVCAASNPLFQRQKFLLACCAG